MWILIPFLIGVYLWVHHTTYGRTFRIVGFSPEAARFAGIPVRRRVAAVYILAGVAAALAAIIYSARVGQARADAGTGYELAAIAAVVLGGTSIFGGRGSIVGTLLGVAAIAILHNGLVHARLPRELAGLLTGVLLLVALAASSAGPLVRRFRSRISKSTPTSSTS
jgi:rhamnose transport system permease protein